MAFGNQKRQENPNQKRYSFVIRTKDLPKPHFEVKVRGADGKFQKLDNTAEVVSGKLVSIKHSENKYQGKTIKSVNVVMEDGDDLYFVTIPYSNLGRGILNSLCAVDGTEDVSIALYQTKAKTEGGKTYPAAAVRQGDELVKWEYGQDELPEVKKVPFQGTMLSDTTNLDAFLQKAITDKAAELFGKGKSSSKKNEEDDSDASNGSDEDIPF